MDMETAVIVYEYIVYNIIVISTWPFPLQLLICMKIMHYCHGSQPYFHYYRCSYPKPKMVNPWSHEMHNVG